LRVRLRGSVEGRKEAWGGESKGRIFTPFTFVGSQGPEADQAGPTMCIDM